MTEKNGIMRFFRHRVITDENISQIFNSTAERLNMLSPNCAEKSAGLRKLLESRDCFLRAITKEKNG